MKHLDSIDRMVYGYGLAIFAIFLLIAATHA